MNVFLFIYYFSDIMEFLQLLLISSEFLKFEKSDLFENNKK